MEVNIERFLESLKLEPSYDPAMDIHPEDHVDAKHLHRVQHHSVLPPYRTSPSVPLQTNEWLKCGIYGVDFIHP